MPVRKREYHHGDLRQACVDDGVRLLSAEGKEAVSLREVARRCGVSTRAPYRHFADKTEFLAAIAVVGFQQFGAALQRAGKKLHRRGARQRLEGLAQAYVDFALRNPAMIELMFGNDFPQRKQRFPELDGAALATFAMLESEVGSKLHAAIAWSLVHGLSALLRSGQFENVLPSRTDRRSLIRTSVEMVLRGMQ